jgi:hypothetical protein
MYHTIEFPADVIVDLEVSRNQPLEKVRFQKGTRVQVEIKPYVIETKKGLVEVADLFFDNGRISRRMPFAKFVLVD